ncbi:autophagy-related protein 13 [Crassisporium funariophilum]|nr:autophagy-related protein 13 [Crassisporium funariophilum]
MSNETHKADQIAFHFYTKLFYTVNHARATDESTTSSRVDKWFNLEIPDSDLFSREAREPFKNISLAPAPGPPPLEIQVLLAVPELTPNHVLVHITPSPSPSTRLRIEPTPRYILLETWTLTLNPGTHASDPDVALPTIYKHGIPLFRSLFSLLRVLPAWKVHKRLRRRVGGGNRAGHLGIQVRIRGANEGVLGFGELP